MSILQLAQTRPATAQAALNVVVVATPVAALVSSTPLVVLGAGLSLALIILLLWRSEDPPILLLPALFQWSEVSIAPISTIWMRVPFEELSPHGADLTASATYGLLGVTALAVGMRVGLGRRTAGSPISQRLRLNTLRWNYRDVLRVTLAAMIAGYGLSTASNWAGGAKEILNHAGNIRYVGIFAITYWCVLHRSHYLTLAAVVAFEALSGMTGFFADFKDSLLTVVVAAAAARPNLRRGDVVVLGASLGVLLTVAIFWSATKSDYRNFVNDGTGAQAILVSLPDRVQYMLGSMLTFDLTSLQVGFDRLVSRHGYIEFLGLVLQNVPTNIPQENGNLTFAVLQHITMPRFLFPGKPPLPSDTMVMSYYTGLPYTWNENTSISIGYLGELYIDFGWLGGVVAAMVLGLIVGRTYRIVSRRRDVPDLLVAGLALTAVLPIAYFGTAYAKMMGAFVFSALLALVWKWAFPALLKRLLGPVGRVVPGHDLQADRY